jgi:hypothetical protein
LNSKERIATLLNRVIAELTTLELPAAVDEGVRREFAESLDFLERRLRLGGDAPLCVAFFGPTGAGKSKLFNSLLGRELSSSGYRRPYTMQPVCYLHDAASDFFPQWGGGVRTHDDPRWREWMVVDTPDFDSVEQQNRREAERIFHQADAFIFVTDVQKYADQVSWEYLERIVGTEKPVVLVLNKVTGGTVAAEFDALLEKRVRTPGRVLERTTVGEHAVDDAMLLPDSEPGLKVLQGAVRGFVESPPGRQELLLASLRGAAVRVWCQWESLAHELTEYRCGLDALRERLDKRYQRGALGLERDLESAVDAGLKREVYTRVLERIEKIDPFRYPRKLLALPVEGIKNLYRMWRPAPEQVTEDVEDLDRSDSLRVLEGLLLRLAEETRQDFMTEKRCPGLLVQQDFFKLPLARDEVLEIYRERMDTYTTWLRQEAGDAAAMVTNEHKLKFVLSQVLYNSVVVGAQIHTAGAFTLGELFTDSIVSPLVAKAVGVALSSERVRWFEKQAQCEYHRLLAEIVVLARERFAAHLEQAAAWSDQYEKVEEAAKQLEGACEGLETAFHQKVE